MSYQNNIFKIHIDSRFRTKNSKNTSNFEIQLSEFLTLDQHTRIYIDEITIPNTFYNITNNNNKLYVSVKAPDNPDQIYRIIEFEEDNHDYNSLALVLKANLENAFEGVGFDIDDSTFERKKVYQISTTTIHTFKIYTDEELKNNLFPLTYDIQNPQTINKVLGIVNASDLNNTYQTKIIDLRASIHNLFLHSSALSSYQIIGPDNSKTIIKKIPITSSFGSVVYDFLATNELDYILVDRLQLSMLDFALRDSFGNDIDLNGFDISFSIIFKNDIKTL
jgi:hypothetical protein